MKLTKKMIAILLAFAMCFSLLCMVASAENPNPIDLEKIREGAGMIIYDGLKARQENIAFTYAIKYDVSSDKAAFIMRSASEQLLAEALIKLTLDTEITALYNAAVFHNDKAPVPDGGDYLARQCLSFKAYYSNFNFSKLLSEGIVIVNVNVKATYRSTASEEKAVDDAVKQIIAELDLKNKDYAYDKVEAIYDWMYGTDESPNIGFDNMGIAFYETTPEASSAYAALVKKSTTSEGFALAFYRLCCELGIDCRIVSAETDNLPHVWNIVKLDNGEWYYIDSSRGEGKVEYLLPTSPNPEKVFFLRGTHYWSTIPVFTAGDQYLNPLLYPGFAKSYPVSRESYLSESSYNEGVHQCQRDKENYDVIYYPPKVDMEMNVTREAYYECRECGRCYWDATLLNEKDPVVVDDDSGESGGSFNPSSFLNAFKNFFDDFFERIAQFFRSFLLFC